MEAIQYFLNNLPAFNPCTNSEQNSVKGKDKVGLYLQKVSKASQQDKCQIKIADASYIRVELIPFFDSLTWRTKKVKDYQD